MRLWQRFFIAFTLLSGTVLLGFTLWQQFNFRRGFIAYLDAVTMQRLEPAAERLAKSYAQNGGWDFLRTHPPLFAELIEPMPADRPPPPDAHVLMMQHDDPPLGYPPGLREIHRLHGPPPGIPELMPRLQLVDADGALVAGNPRVPADAATLPIEQDGRRVGTLRIAPLPHLSGATDLAFARAQLQSTIFAGIAMLVGALVFAFALARWLLAPVRALADGTRALAGGDYARRIEATRSDELGALARDFNHLADSLERNRDARRRWGADIAHELRTPLSILRGEIQALQDGVRPLNRAALDSLHAECDRLGSLIDDLYQLALADAGALDYRFEPLDLADLVRDVVMSQRRRFDEAGLVIEERLTRVEARPDSAGTNARTSDPIAADPIASGVVALNSIAPDPIESASSAPAAIVRGDARRLTQLVVNLLANSSRYTDAPGRVRIEVTSDATSVRLCVEDTAPGVPSDALPRLFERLYRVESSRARSAGGAGLGLAICRAIAEAHRGSIDAAPSPLGGLRVTVTLPAESAP